MTAVLFTCGREGQYPRNQALCQALEQHFHVNAIVDDDLTLSIPARSLRLLWRIVTSGALQQCDLIVVGFSGHILTPALRLLTRKPILLDALTSAYDTLCLDRQRFSPQSIAGRAAYALDWLMCRSATRVMLDTHTHAQFFVELFGLAPGKVDTLYLGGPDSTATPLASPGSNERFTVFTVTGFLPLHGLDVVIEAARRLPDAQFILAGDGPLRSRFAETENVKLPGRIPYIELAAHIAQADICLGGHFSNIPKAHRVIASKTFQFLSNGKPTIVGDTIANREVLVHGVHAYLCRTGDPVALADAVRTLQKDAALRARLSENGRAIYQQRLSVEAAGETLRQLIEEMMKRRTE